MQSDIDKKREDWVKKKVQYIDVYHERQPTPSWKSPVMLVEIKKEEDEKTIK